MKESNTHPIAVAYGDDPHVLVPTLLEYFDVASKIGKHSIIGIKPNLVVSKPSNSGATTDPAVVEAVIVYLKSKGFQDIVILESAWVGDDTDQAFEVCGYKDLSRRLSVPLVNLEQDTSSAHRVDGTRIHICDWVSRIDYLINIPVLKAHCQTKLTCALKNLKGLIPHSEKQRFHTMGLSRPIALLSKAIPSDFVIVDGIVGDLSFEEGGRPLQMNRLIAGHDSVLIDAYAATLLGYDPKEIAYIPLAENLHVGSADLTGVAIEALNRSAEQAIRLPDRRLFEGLLKYIDEDQACSACLAGLIHGLNRLREEDRLRGPLHSLKIGQGFKKLKGSGPGIGRCTKGMEKTLNGCPPSASDIRKFLLEYWSI